MPDSCSNPGCKVGCKCPVCERRFVSQAQEVCATCGPWACEKCGQRSSFAFKKRKTDRELHYEAETLMGWGEPQTGRCTRCGKIKRVGEMGTCRLCIEDKLDVTELVCKDCHEETEWMKEDLEDKYCEDCGELRSVNEDFICKSCFDKRKNFMQDQSLMRCYNCQSKFSPITAYDNFCVKCKPSCKACGGKFNPEEKTEVFCETCLENMRAGHCTNCYAEDKFLDDRGQCGKCAEYFGVKKSDLIYCPVCEVEQVSYRGEACSNCRARIISCPRCYETKIEAKEYICSKCKLKPRIKNIEK